MQYAVWRRRLGEKAARGRMEDFDRLKSLLDSGTLLHPVSDAVSIVDFAAALHSAIGAGDKPLGRNAAIVRALMGDPEHLVFALVDGFGMNFMETLGESAFLRRNMVTEMRTVFPSTTSTALTTLATGAWPARHAVMGWHALIPRLNEVSVIIGFRRSPDGKPLSELGVSVEEAYPQPSKMGVGRHSIARNAAYLLPHYIAGTAYSGYWAGGARQMSYQSIEGAVRAVLRRAGAPGVTYLYMPQVDGTAHERGAAHPATLKAAADADRALERLADALPPSARIVMTADHGHLDAPREKTYTLAPDDELLRLSRAKPSGDIRVMYADVRDEDKPAFRRAARDRLGGDFAALDIREAEELRLFGPEPLSEPAKRRVGSMMLLSVNSAILDFRRALGEKSGKTLRSHHSGLTPAEMRIPLVVA